MILVVHINYGVVKVLEEDDFVVCFLNIVEAKYAKINFVVIYLRFKNLYLFYSCTRLYGFN